MQFDDLKEEVKGISFDSLRMDCDNYFEGVVLKDELNKLTAKLEAFFGSPAWPSRNRIPYRAQEMINGFGGIMSGQTLYFWNQGKSAVAAMLWPWQDGQRTTIKIILK
jgi:hypothetical protein